MEKQNIVSIWLGKFNSKEEWREYLKEIYNESGDISSQFMNDFNISFYDNQFFESEFIINPTMQNLIEPLSYSDFFKKNFLNIENGINVVIAIYNFEFSKNILNKNNVKFIDSFSYKL